MRPQLGSNITFTNNTAQYGPNIASYPFKITFQNSTSDQMKLDDLGSGIKYGQDLKLTLRDFDDQVMVLDNENQIILTSQNSDEATVKGFNSAILRQGVATFDNFILSAKPGSQGINVVASSKAIDRNTINTVFGKISDNIIKANLRY